MSNDPESPEDEYLRLLPSLRRARTEARAALVSILGGLEEGQLVRAYLAGDRIKGRESVAAKLGRKGARADQMLEAVGDLIGFRVVCNNIEDVDRIRAAVVAAERFQIVDVENYIENPQPSGYRALHVNVRFTPTGTTESFPTEIQVCTVAQHAWATLTHYDIYKQDAPLDLRNHAQRLASLLRVADEMATDLREEARRPVPAARDTVLGGSPTGDSFALIFERAFGNPAPDYVARSAEILADENGLRRLDGLDAVLQSEEFRSDVSDAFEDSAGWRPSDETLFEIGIIAAAKDVAEAKRIAVARGAAERLEIESIWRREVLSELPPTFDELVEMAAGDPQSGDLSLSRELFEAAGALHECALCGTDIIDDEAFVEAALEHYGLDEDPDGRLTDVLLQAGYETGFWDNPSFCGYHGYQLSRD